MTTRAALGVALFVMVGVADAQPAAELTVPFVVTAGRPLRIAVNDRVKIAGAGQAIAGTLLDPIDVYDRIVVPAGTPAAGHIVAMGPVSGGRRTLSAINGDFTPARAVSVTFTELTVNGRALPIEAVVTGITENLRQVTAPVEGDEPSGPVGRARDEGSRAAREVARSAREALSSITRPGRWERLRYAVLARLPVHGQYFAPGTVLTARLQTSIDFGVAARQPAAPAGTVPAPSSVLNVRLVSQLDSANAVRGAPVTAVLTQPLLSTSGDVILPEGTEVHGSVTLATGARRFHRNGKLRFLFDSVAVPGRRADALVSSVRSVQADAGDRVALDDEGGAKATNSNLRFALPAIAVIALTSVADPAEAGAIDVQSGFEQTSIGANRAAAGFVGLGLVGTAASAFSKPAAIVLGTIGAARSVYGAVFGRGRNVVFPADTSLQLQLAPKPRSPDAR